MWLCSSVFLLMEATSELEGIGLYFSYFVIQQFWLRTIKRLKICRLIRCLRAPFAVAFAYKLSFTFYYLPVSSSSTYCFAFDPFDCSEPKLLCWPRLFRVCLPGPTLVLGVFYEGGHPLFGGCRYSNHSQFLEFIFPRILPEEIWYKRCTNI